MASYYISQEYVNVLEDHYHEFKGHSSFSWENISFNDYNEQGRPSRQPIFRTITSLMNSDAGGIIYLGVLDDGLIKGLSFSRDMCVHLELSLFDCMERCCPPLPRHRIQLRFVPVLCHKPSAAECAALQSNPQLSLAPRPRLHLLRAARLCWCQQKGYNRLTANILLPTYVVEIHVKAWCPLEAEQQLLSVVTADADESDRSDADTDAEFRFGVAVSAPDAAQLLLLRPLFMGHLGGIFVRGQGGLKHMELPTVIAHTRVETEQLLLARRNELRERLQALRARCAVLGTEAGRGLVS